VYSWLKGDVAMAARLLAALAFMLVLAAPAGAQDLAPAPAAAPDGVDQLLDGLRAGLLTADEAVLAAWVSTDAAPGVRAFTAGLLQPGREIVRELTLKLFEQFHFRHNICRRSIQILYD
jgi:hypothetical protein